MYRSTRVASIVMQTSVVLMMESIRMPSHGSETHRVCRPGRVPGRAWKNDQGGEVCQPAGSRIR